MIKRTLFLTTMLLMVACSSTETTPDYYAIALPSNNEQVLPVNSKPVVAVQNVELADYLNELGIVYQQNDVQLTSANQHRWAEALDKQLTRALLQSLRAAQPDYQWQTNAQVNATTPQLNISVHAFHGLADGHAVISGEWRLTKGMQSYTGEFNQQFPLKDDGYPALVRALGDGWQTIIQQMASKFAPLLK